MCIRIFIRQTMKLIALYKLNQRMWICDILSLNLRPHTTSEKLRHTCAWVVFKGYSSRLLISHCVGFNQCCIWFPCLWKTRRWLWRLRFFKNCCCFYILQSLSALFLLQVASISKSIGTKLPAEGFHAYTT